MIYLAINKSETDADYYKFTTLMRAYEFISSLDENKEWALANLPFYDDAMLIEHSDTLVDDSRYTLIS